MNVPATGRPVAMPRVYLRREPADDNTPDRFDVVAYRDRRLRNRYARWPWWASTKPGRRAATVMLNCSRWRAVWI